MCACVFQLLTSCLPTDKRVLSKVKQLTLAGVRHVPEMQRLIQDFVCNVLFAGRSPPPRFDARFWPSVRVFRNCMYRYTKRIQARSVFISDVLTAAAVLLEIDHILAVTMVSPLKQHEKSVLAMLQLQEQQCFGKQPLSVTAQSLCHNFERCLHDSLNR